MCFLLGGRRTQFPLHLVSSPATKSNDFADSLVITISQRESLSSVRDAYYHRQREAEHICIKCCICLIQKVASKTSSKADLSIADEEDISDDSPACSFTLLVKQVFIADLDMKILVLEILADNLDLLLISEFTSCVCLSAEVVILFCCEQ
jgi:hypothetical protein